MGYQKVLLIGNVGRDPEVRYTASGTAVANFSLAVNEKWNNRDGESQERVTWFQVVAWGRLAEICGEYMTKGRQVFIEGRIQNKEWEDRDGGTRRRTEVVASSVQLLGRRDDTSDSGDDRERHDEGVSDGSEDDIPF